MCFAILSENPFGKLFFLTLCCSLSLSHSLSTPHSILLQLSYQRPYDCLNILFSFCHRLNQALGVVLFMPPGQATRRNFSAYGDIAVIDIHGYAEV